MNSVSSWKRGSDFLARFTFMVEGGLSFIWRSSPYPLLPIFDAPYSTTSSTRRVRSNTPLQALTLANDHSPFELIQASGTGGKGNSSVLCGRKTICVFEKRCKAAWHTSAIQKTRRFRECDLRRVALPFKDCRRYYDN